MADLQYMTINPDWTKDDNMENFLATGWLKGSGSSALQQDGYVSITQSAGSDTIVFPLGTPQTFPYVIDCLVEAKGADNHFVTGDGTNTAYITFPDTGGNARYYRIIIRQINTKPGSIELYENGKLIKTRINSVTSETLTSLYYYVNGDAVAGDYLNIYHHKHSFGEDWGEPADSTMRDSIKLDGSTGYTLLFDRLGLTSPPVSIEEDQIPFEAGSIERVTNTESRLVTLGIMVQGTNKSDLNEKKRYLSRVLRQRIKLFSKMSDGYRYLACRLVSGMEGEESTSTTAGTTWQKFVLVFKAFDPFWYKTQTKITDFDTYTDTVNNVTKTLNYNGESKGYIDVYLRGPGLFPSVKNKTTGESFSLGGSTLTSTNIFHIRTKPGERFIKNENYALSWDRLSQGSNQLFGLVNGKNSIEIRFPGASTSTNTLGRIVQRECMLGE